MGRYSNIHRCIWNDDKFPFVDDDLQLVFFHLLSTPISNQFGFFKSTIAALAAEKRWPEEKYEKAFQEGLRQGFFKQDERHQLIWVVHYLEYNKPNNPNVLQSWGRDYHELPDSPLKTEFFQFFESLIKDFGEGFQKAFGKAFIKPSRKAPVSVSVSVSEEDRGPGEETTGFNPDRINSDTPLPPTLQAEWDLLLGIWGRLGNVIKGRDKAVRGFARSAERARILRNAEHYVSTDSARAFPMRIDRFVEGEYRDYDEVPTGGSEHAARDKLREALLDRRNEKYPPATLPPESNDLFLAKGIPWQELRRQVQLNPECL